MLFEDGLVGGDGFRYLSFVYFVFTVGGHFISILESPCMRKA